MNGRLPRALHLFVVGRDVSKCALESKPVAAQGLGRYSAVAGKLSMRMRPEESWFGVLHET